MITAYAPELPIELNEEGNFSLISDVLKNVRQNLKMILLTNPGEKIYEPEFGLGIYKYVFEPSSGIVSRSGDEEALTVSSFEDEITTNLYKQVARYCQGVSITDLSLQINDSYMKITISYNYKDYINDSLTVTTEV